MASISLSRIVSHWTAIQPDRVALDHLGDRRTWAELESRTNRLARAYELLGVKADDFVTVALPNGCEFVEACLAIWKLGATPQPISSKLPKFERDQIIELGQPTLVVGVDDDEYAPTPCLHKGFVPDADLPDSALPERTATSFKAMTSGGSTGRPKLIVSKLPAAWDPEDPYLEIVNQGTMLIPGPLYHNGPFLWAMIALFKGCTIVIATRFDAEQVLEQIETTGVDIVYLVPTMMRRIWALPEDVRTKYDLSSLRAVWHLAAPCPAWLKEAFIEWMGAEVIWELYGGRNLRNEDRRRDRRNTAAGRSG